MPDEVRYELNNPPIVAEMIEDEGVAIDLKSGRYYSLLGPAAQIWRHLLSGYSPAEILASAGAASEAEAGALSRFVATLRDEGLIRPRRGSAPSQALPPMAPWGAEALKLESFNDMQDMLTLDPIHEIDDDFGWPRPAPGA